MDANSDLASNTSTRRVLQPSDMNIIIENMILMQIAAKNLHTTVSTIAEQYLFWLKWYMHCEIQSHAAFARTSHEIVHKSQYFMIDTVLMNGMRLSKQFRKTKITIPNKLIVCKVK